MLHGIRKKVKVQPGGIIEIRSGELQPGTDAEVIVLFGQAQSPVSSLVSFLGRAKGGFGTPEEVDTFIRKERDAW